MKTGRRRRRKRQLVPMWRRVIVLITEDGGCLRVVNECLLLRQTEKRTLRRTKEGKRFINAVWILLSHLTDMAICS